MDIKSVIDIAQAATALATFIALILLLRQLQLLRGQLLMSNQLSVMKDERDIWQMALGDRTARDGLVKTVFGEENPKLAPSENLIAMLLFDHYEKVYFQHRRGAFPAELWPSWEAHITTMIAQPYMVNTWHSSKEIYWSDFSNHFDEKLRLIANDSSNAGR